MRSRWFHLPLLHTEHDHEKKVSWLELFYDLIFVASLCVANVVFDVMMARSRSASSTT